MDRRLTMEGGITCWQRFVPLALRMLATALGTSHRMQIFHFGCKQQLWVEIVQTVEQRQRELLGDILPDPTVPAGEAMPAWWKHISDPSLWPNERLFYELYGQRSRAAPTRPHCSTASSRTGSTRSPRSNLALGIPASVARAHARLGVAVTRGLLLDLLATRDVAGVDAAMEAYISVYEAWLREAARGAVQEA